MRQTFREVFSETMEKGDFRVWQILWRSAGTDGAARGPKRLLADAAFTSGKYVQGFPEYGPERMGAPITAYNRISVTSCEVHSLIYTPDFVVVVDETLLESVDVTAGLRESGAIIINSSQSPQALRSQLRGYSGRVCTIDARRISEAVLGSYFPNTPMLAAAVKVSGVIEPERFMSNMEIAYRHKFATKPHVIDKNLQCLKQSMKEVRVG